jgi:DnaJ homolog subfamily C member 9
VPDDKKEEAKEKFQSIAFAYAILSDPARRKRYDETGSTSESIVDAEGFSWSDYYNELYREAVSAEAIEKFSKKYKRSDEEKDELLAAYDEFEGDMDKVYETVMLSNVEEDDERFRSIIDDAIASGDVEAYPAYTRENKKTRKARVKAARREAQEAEELAKELGVHDKLNGKKSKKDSTADLQALIQRNQSKRASAFDSLLEKYGGAPKSKAGKKRGNKEMEEPDIPDDEFEALQAKITKKSKKKRAS